MNKNHKNGSDETRDFDRINQNTTDNKGGTTITFGDLNDDKPENGNSQEITKTNK